MASLRFRMMTRLWADAENGYREKLLASLPRIASARLLDVGCDDGAWTAQLQQRLGTPADRVSGLEIVPERAAQAAARGFDVHVVDIEGEWPLADGSIDIVHANQVIEHVKNLDNFVEQTWRVLSPSGYVLVCTENLASWHNVGALVLGYQPFSLTNISGRRRAVGNKFALHLNEDPGLESWQHVHVVTLDALRDLFDSHGFRVEAAWGAGYHPFPGPIAARLASADPRHAHFIGIVARPRG